MLKAIPTKIQVLLKFKSQDSSDDFLDTEKGGPLAILSKQQQKPDPKRFIPTH
jgi:hypothetical protein